MKASSDGNNVLTVIIVKVNKSMCLPKVMRKWLHLVLLCCWLDKINQPIIDLCHKNINMSHERKAETKK